MVAGKLGGNEFSDKWCRKEIRGGDVVNHMLCVGRSSELSLKRCCGIVSDLLRNMEMGFFPSLPRSGLQTRGHCRVWHIKICK